MSVLDYFIVVPEGDRLNSSYCIGSEEAREAVSCFAPCPVTVWRVTPDELVRDVTEDFLTMEPVSVYAGFDPDREYDRRIA